MMPTPFQAFRLSLPQSYTLFNYKQHFYLIFSILQVIGLTAIDKKQDRGNKLCLGLK